jgi:hypothetical protein
VIWKNWKNRTFSVISGVRKNKKNRFVDSS